MIELRIVTPTAPQAVSRSAQALVEFQYACKTWLKAMDPIDELKALNTVMETIYPPDKKVALEYRNEMIKIIMGEKIGAQSLR